MSTHHPVVAPEPPEVAGTERGGDSAESTATAVPAETTFPPEEIGCPNFLVDYEDRRERRSPRS